MKSTINQEEVNKFAKISDEWWNENGKFKPLHKFNPIRIKFIKDSLMKFFTLKDDNEKPLQNLKILDVGCGGGLVAESLTKLGAKITGIDAAAENIEVAKTHAKSSNLTINYQNLDIEELALEKPEFDVVLALEIIEHVDHPKNFILALSECVKEGGVVIIATINRTPLAFVNAIIGAEYLLKWLPKGTHNWKKFFKPSEISAMAKESDLDLYEAKGFRYDLIADKWSVSQNLSINYALVFKKIK